MIKNIALWSLCIRVDTISTLFFIKSIAFEKQIDKYEDGVYCRMLYVEISNVDT